MNRYSILPLALTLATGLAACGEDVAPGGESGEGQPDDLAIYTDHGDVSGPVGRPDVEYIGLVVLGGGTCSGILIGAHTALTATHCGAAVGDDIAYADDHYSVAKVISPPDALKTQWGSYDVTMLVLDREVVYPGTKTAFQSFAKIATRTIKVGETIACNGQGPNAIQNHTPINTGATDGASNGYHWGGFDIVGIETGPFYRVVPAVEHGDSGGPCFWGEDNGGQVLAGLNSSTVGTWGEYPESSAIVSIADNADAVRWIRRNMR